MNPQKYTRNSVRLHYWAVVVLGGWSSLLLGTAHFTNDMASNIFSTKQDQELQVKAILTGINQSFSELSKLNKKLSEEKISKEEKAETLKQIEEALKKLEQLQNAMQLMADKISPDQKQDWDEAFSKIQKLNANFQKEKQLTEKISSIEKSIKELESKSKLSTSELQTLKDLSKQILTIRNELKGLSNDQVPQELENRNSEKLKSIDQMLKTSERKINSLINAQNSIEVNGIKQPLDIFPALKNIDNTKSGSENNILPSTKVPKSPAQEGHIGSESFPNPEQSVPADDSVNRPLNASNFSAPPPTNRPTPNRSTGSPIDGSVKPNNDFEQKNPNPPLFNEQVVYNRITAERSTFEQSSPKIDALKREIASSQFTPDSKESSDSEPVAVRDSDSNIGTTAATPPIFPESTKPKTLSTIPLPQGSNNAQTGSSFTSTENLPGSTILSSNKETPGLSSGEPSPVNPQNENTAGSRALVRESSETTATPSGEFSSPSYTARGAQENSIPPRNQNSVDTTMVAGPVQPERFSKEAQEEARIIRGILASADINNSSSLFSFLYGGPRKAMNSSQLNTASPAPKIKIENNTLFSKVLSLFGI